MKLKVLGTQSPYNTPGHNSPGFLITDREEKLLLDCGSGSHSLLNFPRDLKNLVIFLTHLHRDHYNDIYNLQYASHVFHNQGRLKNPITVYLPKSPASIYTDIIKEPNAYAEYYYLSHQYTLYIGDMRIYFMPTDHPVETYAVKVTDGKGTIVYTSDTSFTVKDDMVKFAKGADLLICESSLLKRHGFPEINSHLTAEQAAIIARDARVKMLMLTHFWPEESIEDYEAEAKNIFGNVVVAREGEEFVI